MLRSATVPLKSCYIAITVVGLVFSCSIAKIHFQLLRLIDSFLYTAPNLVEMVEIKEKRIILASPTVSLETSLFKRANISKRVYSLPYYLCGSKSSKSVPLFSKPSDNRHGLASQGGVIFSKKNISHQSIRGHLYISCWSSEIRIPPEELVGA